MSTEKLFSQLGPLLQNAQLTITLTMKDGLICVATLPSGRAKDDDVEIQSLNITGSAEELDEKFLGLIIQPISRATALFSNLDQFNESVTKAEEESKDDSKDTRKSSSPTKPVDKKKEEAEKKKQDLEAKALAKKQEEEAKKKELAEKKFRLKVHEGLVKKADLFQKEKDVKKAIGCLIEAKEYSDNPEVLDKRIDQIIAASDPMMTRNKQSGKYKPTLPLNWLSNLSRKTKLKFRCQLQNLKKNISRNQPQLMMPKLKVNRPKSRPKILTTLKRQ